LRSSFVRATAAAVSLAVALSLHSRSAGASVVGGPDPTADSAPAPKPPAPERPAPAERFGVLGPFRLGALGGVGFPRPLSVEGIVAYRDWAAVGVEYSALPAITVSGVRATLDAVDVDLRAFPLRNSLFVALAIGHQRFDATTTVALPMGLGSLPEEATADTWFVNPRVGFLWRWSWGLSLGLDAGAQIPVASSFTSTVPSQLAVARTVTDWSHVIGKDVLPTLTGRLGFLF
jgi:hypothetical protein